MNKIREILLTEYIGAILVALLVSDAIIALVTLLVGQIYWHVALAGRYHESLGHSILTTFVRMLLYLASAYVLARWLYGAKPPVTRGSTESLRTSRGV
jgi:ABC-type sulfate transport system permease component